MGWFWQTPVWLAEGGLEEYFRMVGQLRRPINCGTDGKDSLVTIDSKTFRISCVASEGEDATAV